MRIENNVKIYSSTREPTRLLEQAFLEEMTKYAFPKIGAADFSGGVGEEQFSSFLSREYANAVGKRIKLGVEVKPHE